MKPIVRRDDLAREQSPRDPDGVLDDAVDPDFDEATYLHAFPDIEDAVRRGLLESGLTHFRQTGRAEARLNEPAYRKLMEARSGLAPPMVVVDALTLSPGGYTLITGWTDDRVDPLTAIDPGTFPETTQDLSTFPRLLRSDVERTVDAGSDHRFGFLMIAGPDERAMSKIFEPRQARPPVFRFASGVAGTAPYEPVVTSDSELRDLALSILPTAAAGDTDPEATYRILDQDVGAQIAALNRFVNDQARMSRLIESFGPERARYRGSVIISARGAADQIVPWLTLTGGGPGAEDYEFIIVITQPDQFEQASRAARAAEATLGLRLTVILQNGGEPGCNAALDVAGSDRLIFMDQTVLPRDPDWLTRHSALLDSGPEEQTRLMGGLLYQADGSLCHGGYYFEHDTSALPPSRDPPRRMDGIRLKPVAHAATPADFLTPHPVVGVSAKFLSVDRAWFESLGGFIGQYSRAAHEDIDLCLRSLRNGVPAWVHPLPMWNLERLPPLAREPPRGGAILNAWLLHRRWRTTIVPDLCGPIPALFETHS